MPRSIDIDQFDVKLSLIRDRLSLSRVQLAHAVGVDKSVAARWLSARVRPGDQNLIRLTGLVRREIADFFRGDWDLPLNDFAERLGMAAPGGLDGHSWPGYDADVARYEGLWFITHAALTGMRRLFGLVLELYEERSTLHFELGSGITHATRGTASVNLDKLYLIGQCGAASGGDVRLIYLLLNGVEMHRAVVMDGLLMTRYRDIAGSPAAARAIAWRIAPRRHRTLGQHGDVSRPLQPTSQGITGRCACTIACRDGL